MGHERQGPFVIGLTGNIAAGKSTVAKMLADLGAERIDADALAHHVMRPGTAANRHIAERFGSSVVSETGEIDRHALGAIVFNDASALRDLEEIVHPAAIALTKELVATCDAKVCVVEAIKLLETEIRDICSAIWVVAASEEVRAQRLVEIRGLTKDQARTRIVAQEPEALKIAQADIVIDNGGTLQSTERQVAQAWQAIKTSSNSVSVTDSCGGEWEMKDQKRILIMAAEMTPFARTGEVAVVVASLARALAKQGHDVRVAIPRYQQIGIGRFGLKPAMPPYVVPLDDHGEQATLYETTTDDGLPVYMVDSPRYWSVNTVSSYVEDAEPFIFFCRATLEGIKQPDIDWRPDVIHCHDWQTALVPNWLATLYSNDAFYQDTATVFTVHRLSHQGIFGHRVLQIAGIEEHGFIYHAAITDLGELVDLLARGLVYADAITTVSKTYAEEIQTRPYGERLDPLLRDLSDRLFGIVNGIDYGQWDPSTDPVIQARYDADSLADREANKLALQRQTGLDENPDTPVLSMVSRLTDNKGFDLLIPFVERILDHLDIQLVIMGVGEPEYHTWLQGMAERYPGRVALYLTFNDAIEHQIYAGSDMHLMPSRVEPCGLGQMVALRYGSVPIVRHTGGLADTVEDYDATQDTGTGFTFEVYDELALYAAVVRATEVYRNREAWQQLQVRGMTQDHSWQHSAREYELVYRWASEHRGESRGYGVYAS